LTFASAACRPSSLRYSVGRSTASHW